MPPGKPQARPSVPPELGTNPGPSHSSKNAPKWENNASIRGKTHPKWEIPPEEPLCMGLKWDSPAFPPALITRATERSTERSAL